MKQQQIPYPRGNLNEWARQLFSYLNENQPNKQQVLPQVVLLPHQTADRNYSADINGLLMFDPVNKVVVVSVDGEWRQLQLVP